MKLPSIIFRSGLAAALTTILLVAAPAVASSPVVAAAAARATSAGLPEEMVQLVVSRGEDRGLADEAIGAALTTLERAAARGLPAGGVADKFLEGIAKGVPPQRLQQVLDGMVARLVEADEALAALPAELDARQSLVEEGAEALRRGASPKALAALAGEAGGTVLRQEQFSLALRELGDLGEQRVAGADAGMALGRMISRGYAASAVRELSERVAEALAEGAAPAELLEEIAVRASSGRPLDRLVDPFSTRPGRVLRDPAAHRNLPTLPDAARGKGVQGHPHGGPPGQSGLDRPGLPTAPGQQRRLEKGRGKPDGLPGKGPPPGKGPGAPGGPGKGQGKPPGTPGRGPR